MAENIAFIILIFGMLYHTVVCLKDAEGMTNGVDPDQTAWNEIIWNEKGFEWNPSSLINIWYW